MRVFETYDCIFGHLASDGHLTFVYRVVGDLASQRAVPKPVDGPLGSVDGLLGPVDGVPFKGRAYLFVVRGVRREVDDVLSEGATMLWVDGG